MKKQNFFMEIQCGIRLYQWFPIREEFHEFRGGISTHG